MGLDNSLAEVEFNKTHLVQERLMNNPFFEKATAENRNGRWQDRNIIGRDVAINGGVYLGGGSREAIVVDDEKQPELKKAYGQLKARIEALGGDYKNNALNEVFQYVRDVMPYSQDIVDQVAANFHLEPDQKVGLARYLERGGGVCRHQALMCGYLLEKLKSDGYISGQVSVDRNFIPDLRGHAWTRYTNSRGEVFILDVAQNYIGPLKDITKEKYRWVYERPGDKK